MLSQKTGLSDHQVADTLLRTQITCRREGIDSIPNDLVNAIAECEQFKGETYSVIRRTADALRSRMADASTKIVNGLTSDRFSVDADFAKVIDSHILAGKCILKDDILGIFEQCRVQQPTAVTSDDDTEQWVEFIVERLVVRLQGKGHQDERQRPTTTRQRMPPPSIYSVVSVYASVDFCGEAAASSCRRNLATTSCCSSVCPGQFVTSCAVTAAPTRCRCCDQ